MRLFIQPCGDGVPLKHFEETVQAPVELSSLDGLVEESILDSLIRAFPGGRAAMWGIVSGDKERQKKIYLRMQEGDVLLFTRKGSIFALGEVGTTFQSRSAAARLWGTDEVGQTWENMFAIKQLTYHDINGIEFKRIVGYDDGYVFRGFAEVQPERAARFLQSDTVQRFLKGQLLGSSPPNFQSGPTPKPLRGISDPPKEGESFDDRASIWRAFGGDWAETVTTFANDHFVNVFSDDDSSAAFIDPDTGVIEFTYVATKTKRRVSEADVQLENARKDQSPVRFWHRPPRGKWVFESWALVEDRMKLTQTESDGGEQLKTVWFMVPVSSSDPSTWPAEFQSEQGTKLPDLMTEEVIDTDNLLAEYARRSLYLAQESAESTTESKPRRTFKRRKEARDLVLARAKNRCEYDGCAGMPFDKARNGQAILEVDHIIDLALGGPDVPSNMIALCPNCHKAKTFGVNSEKTIMKFQQLVAKKEAELRSSN